MEDKIIFFGGSTTFEISKCLLYVLLTYYAGKQGATDASYA